eukprot:4086177-Pleurochrysis_carterae.AAC.1
MSLEFHGIFRRVLPVAFGGLFAPGEGQRRLRRAARDAQDRVARHTRRAHSARAAAGKHAD